jgi:hypothetical protein
MYTSPNFLMVVLTAARMCGINNYVGEYIYIYEEQISSIQYAAASRCRLIAKQCNFWVAKSRGPSSKYARRYRHCTYPPPECKLHVWVDSRVSASLCHPPFTPLCPLPKTGWWNPFVRFTRKQQFLPCSFTHVLRRCIHILKCFVHQLEFWIKSPK